jgi:hypothetical protein
LLQKLELPLWAEFLDVCAMTRKRKPIDFTRLRFARYAVAQVRNAQSARESAIARGDGIDNLRMQRFEPL